MRVHQRRWLHLLQCRNVSCRVVMAGLPRILLIWSWSWAGAELELWLNEGINTCESTAAMHDNE
jgi:hypothetical protein